MQKLHSERKKILHSNTLNRLLWETSLYLWSQVQKAKKYLHLVSGKKKTQNTLPLVSGKNITPKPFTFGLRLKKNSLPLVSGKKTKKLITFGLR